MSELGFPAKEGALIVAENGVEILADATLSEEYGDQGELTRYPVETNAEVAEHIIREPERLQITVLFTDTPRAQAEQPGRADRAYFNLLALYDQSLFCDVFGARRIYTQMLLTSVSQTVRAEHASHIELTFERVIEVDPVQVFLPARVADPDSQSSTVDQGTSPTDDATAAEVAGAATQAVSNATTLRQGADLVSGAGGVGALLTRFLGG